MKYTNNFCAVCFDELIRPQLTCGSKECREIWHSWSLTTRRKNKNLATYTQSERALIKAQAPEPTPDPDFIENLHAAAAEEVKARDKRPEFIRAMLNPDSLSTEMPTIAPTSNGHPRSCTCEDCIGPYKTKTKKELIDDEHLTLNASDPDPTGDQ